MSELNERIRRRLALYSTSESRGELTVRIATNMIVDSVTVKDGEAGSEAYVAVKINNLCGILFLEDLADLEKQIKKEFQGAWNFALVQFTRSGEKLIFSFVVPWKSLA